MTTPKPPRRRCCGPCRTCEHQRREIDHRSRTFCWLTAASSYAWVNADYIYCATLGGGCRAWAKRKTGGAR